MSDASNISEMVYMTLPSMTREALDALWEEQRKLAVEKGKQLELEPENQSLLSQITQSFSLRYNIDTEIMRREEGLEAKTEEELKQISRDASRKQDRMENYEWEAVKDSPPDNQRGFMNYIDYLETLINATYLEMDRRAFLAKKDS